MRPASIPQPCRLSPPLNPSNPPAPLPRTARAPRRSSYLASSWSWRHSSTWTCCLTRWYDTHDSDSCTQYMSVHVYDIHVDALPYTVVRVLVCLAILSLFPITSACLCLHHRSR